MALLELRGVYKTFNPGTPDEVLALRGIDLTVEAGSFVVVIGTNGSGKSTTLNAVAGSFRVDAGTIRLAGREITRWPEHRRATLIGRVFQDPLAGTSPSLSIAENLALAWRRGLPRGLGRRCPGEARRVPRSLRPLGMGLENRLGNPIGGLSGGQRQAMTLLMATYRRPELLLLDEHTAALDPRSAEQVIRLTDHVVRREQLTTLMVTHSMAQAAALGDRLIMAHQGRLIYDVSGAAKHRLRPHDLLEKFEELAARTSSMNRGPFLRRRIRLNAPGSVRRQSGRLASMFISAILFTGRKSEALRIVGVSCARCSHRVSPRFQAAGPDGTCVMSSEPTSCQGTDVLEARER